ncbi:MAG TPA: MATE family efflux transporter [Paludibacteraceae bacterium]|nr:MATE family efflux transporter [Paludibacteraceae bacterium]HPH62065.1 MATE family efflux transporter [Paludibacteraceae bacterium]
MADVKSPTELGTGNIKKLLIAYSGPAIVAMMASSLYNIIDRIFIGQGVGAMAISGLAITFPLMNLAAAFGAMIGAGGATLVSIKMGQKDSESANKVLGNVLMLNLILGTAFMIFGLIFIDDILSIFGASENTLPYARDFMQIILLGNVVTHLYLGLNSIMRSSGYPRKAMYTTLLTVLVNLILAPIFIFGFDWGIRGAATATVFAQIVALIFVLVHFANKENFIHFKPGIYKLEKRIVSGILAIGMGPFVMHACSCLVVILINNALTRYGGDLAVGAYGIINGIVMLFVMLVLGLNQGMQPIAGYNFGAQQIDRVYEVLRLTIIYATVVMTIAFLLGELIPKQIAMLFTKDEELIRLSTNGMRIVVAAFPIVGFQMVVANFFQSIGKASRSVFLSATRQLIFLIPLLLILPGMFGTNGVWISMPVSDFLSTLIAVGLLYNEIKRKK